MRRARSSSGRRASRTSSASRRPARPCRRRRPTSIPSCSRASSSFPLLSSPGSSLPRRGAGHQAACWTSSDRGRAGAGPRSRRGRRRHDGDRRCGRAGRRRPARGAAPRRAEFTLVSEELGERAFGSSERRRRRSDRRLGEREARDCGTSASRSRSPRARRWATSSSATSTTSAPARSGRRQGAAARSSTASRSAASARRSTVEILAMEGTLAASVADHAEALVGYAQRFRIRARSPSRSASSPPAGWTRSARCARLRSVDTAAAQLLVREVGLSIGFADAGPVGRRPARHAPRGVASSPRRRRSYGPFARKSSSCERRVSQLLGRCLASAEMQPTPEQITEALAEVIDPELKKPVTELGMVRDVDVGGTHIAVTIALTVPGCPLRHSFEEQVQRELSPLPGRRDGLARVRRHEPGGEGGADDAPPRRRERAHEGDLARPLDPRDRRRIGKGGVGKSTLTANLAAAFDRLGQRVGVLDADVYGHSIPHMLGVHQRPVVVDRMIVPPVRDELKLMSIGFFLDENEPVMWRGPMLHRALEQFLSDVHWGELDTLLVDMPPGHRRRLDLARPAAAARRGGRRDDAAAGGAAGGRSRGADGADDEHAAPRRRREHVVLVGSGEEIFGSGGGEALAAELERAAARPDAARPAAARERGPRRAARLGGARGRGVRRDPPARRGDRRHASRGGARNRQAAPRRRRVELAPCGPRTSSRGFARSASTSAEAAVLAEHFLDAERRGKRGHGFSRVEWLATQDVDPEARARRGSSRTRATSAGTATARSAT